MPRFLSTLGNAVLSIAICDRCRMKRAKSVMRSDPNFPGLQVCNEGCQDNIDPYRLAARQTERITIRFPRPDANIAVDTNDLITGAYGNSIISPQQNTQTPSNTGNLDSLST
jgi:hypothetical protein